LIGTTRISATGASRPRREGIRATLVRLHDQLPTTRIVLLGLWPRGATADDPLRPKGSRGQQADPNLRRRRDHYADIGGVLLEKDGTMRNGISPDLLHFSGAATSASCQSSILDRPAGRAALV